MRDHRDRDSAVRSATWKSPCTTVLPVAHALFFFLAVQAQEGSAGLACASNPCYFGVCIDETNGTFMCYCIDGYTGFLCQTNWDECWSNPCMNGGECVDGIAEFNCTCPSGFQGQLCESNVDECLSNPCRNNGTCVDGSNGYSCICPAGYLGNTCETDISVCNDTNEIRCMNGGFCIEGPGFTFNCVCQSGWTGVLCENAVDECASSPCRNGGVCLDLHANYSCACSFGYTGRNCEVELQMCGEESPCQNGALCLIEDWLSICYCVPDYHGDRCQFQYDECQLGPGCKNGGTCIDGVDGYTCSCPPGLTGYLCECLILNDYEFDCNYVAPTTITLFPPITIAHTVPIRTDKEVPITQIYRNTSSTQDFMITTQPTVYIPPRTMPELSTRSTTEKSTVPVLTTERQTTKTKIDVSIDNGPTTELTTSTTTAATTKATTTPSTALTTLTPATTTTSTVAPTTTTTTTTAATTTTSTTAATTTTTSTTAATTTISTTAAATTTPTTTTTTTTTTATTTTSTTPSTPISTTLLTTTAADSITTVYSLFNLTSPVYPPPVTTQKAPKATEISFTQLHPTGITRIDFQPTTQTGFNCVRSPCLNGGMCLNTTSGPRCICKSEWQGVLCEEKAVIKVAAFSGNSYLSHYLNDTSKLKIDLTARTVSPVGLILHSYLGHDIYMTLYLEENLLKFKFSCGVQTMLLSEMQFHINNGYDFTASIGLEFLPLIQGAPHCAATVRINNTLAMSGEQTAILPSPGVTSFVYIGGVPKQVYKELVVRDGFVGCMGNLEINDKPKNIFKDAVDSNDVVECKSLACLSSPCLSGSTCLERNGTWSCICPSGFVGKSCERSVCHNNPCEYGGTCAPFPGSGFICLCPLGKKGLFCENDVDVTHPMYSSSTGGLSSFTAYTLPNEIYEDIMISFKFIPHDMEQISLMLFIGQDGYHGPTSDHLAVSFIKGFVVLTWNLGSGPRRIFTSQPVSDTGTIFHIVKIGKTGQRAWLIVDNQGNVTGKSPGRLSQLNTRSIIYIGGHDSMNFSLLPHDLPLHTGFSGCLFDVEVRSNDRVIKLEKVLASFSRGVDQCGTTLCHEEACKNGGGCIQHGATYTCLCTEGWFGPTCSQKFNPCDSTRNRCSEGSTCVPLKTGYTCDCPPGQTGDYCEIAEEISDVKLKGIRSYIMLSADGLHQQQSCLDLEIRPLDPQGLLLYSGKRDGSGFWSLSLQAGILELRVSPGKHRRPGDILVIKSRRFLTIGMWHRVRVGRYGRRLFLWVEGTVNTGVLLPGESLPPSGTLIYIGGVPDMSALPYGVTAGNPIPYQGCIRKFSSQWKMIPLNMTNILDGRNVEDCDGTVCGGDVCDHGGTCYIDIHNRPLCSCITQYIGDKCEIQVSCKETKCQNGGRCSQGKDLQPKCHCPIGWGGSYCESAVTIESPHFRGNSYIVIDRSTTNTKRRDISSKVEVDFVYLNFTTASPDGVIIWSSRDNQTEFFGIGVKDKKLKIIWSWEGQSQISAVIGEDLVADGNWHDLAISFETLNITIWMDYLVMQRLDVNYPNRTLATDGLFFLGGFPEDKSVEEMTRGQFTSGFSGCIQKLAWSIDSSIVNFSGFEGENIGTCDPSDP